MRIISRKINRVRTIIIQFKVTRLNIKFKHFLKLLILIFSLLSIISLLYISYDGFFVKKLVLDITEIEYFKNFIRLFNDFKDLYIATISLLTIYFALKRVDIAQKSNNNTLQQIKITTTEINNKSKNEIKYNSIEQCNYFYNKIQPSIVEAYKKLKSKDAFWQTSYEWEIGDFTIEDIRRQNIKWIDEFEKLDSETKSIFALVINKLEIFSLNVLDGKLDQQFVFNAIYQMYKDQINILYPIISTMRTERIEDTSNYMNKCVALYEFWRTF